MEVFEGGELQEDFQVGAGDDPLSVFEHGGAGRHCVVRRVGVRGFPGGADPVVAFGGEEFDAMEDEGVFELGFAVFDPALAEGVEERGAEEEGESGEAEGGVEVVESEPAAGGVGVCQREGV